MSFSLCVAVVLVGREICVQRFLTINEMDKNIDQKICLKFCLGNEISCAEAYKMLEKAFGESVMPYSTARTWYRMFKDGREEAEDKPRSGRPSTSTTDDNVDKVKEIVLENRHSSLREVAGVLKVSHESVRSILIDQLGMAPRNAAPRTSRSRRNHARAARKSK